MANPKPPAFFQPGWVTYLRGILILLISVAAWLSSHYLIAPKVDEAFRANMAVQGSLSEGFPRHVFEFMIGLDRIVESTFFIWFGILLAAFLALEIWVPAWKRVRRTVMGFFIALVSISTIVWLWFLALNASLLLP